MLAHNFAQHWYSPIAVQSGVSCIQSFLPRRRKLSKLAHHIWLSHAQAVLPHAKECACVHAWMHACFLAFYSHPGMRSELERAMPDAGFWQHLRDAISVSKVH